MQCINQLHHPIPQWSHEWSLNVKRFLILFHMPYIFVGVTILSFHPVVNLILLFSQQACFLWDWKVNPMPNPQLGGPGSLLCWNLTLYLSSLGDSASSYTTAGLAQDHWITQVSQPQQGGDTIRESIERAAMWIFLNTLHSLYKYPWLYTYISLRNLDPQYLISVT